MLEQAEPHGLCVHIQRQGDLKDMTLLHFINKNINKNIKLVFYLEDKDASVQASTIKIRIKSGIWNEQTNKQGPYSEQLAGGDKR